jgi:hypothetical protein
MKNTLPDGYRERYRCLGGECGWMCISIYRDEEHAHYLDFCPDCWFVRLTINGRVMLYGNADHLPYLMLPSLRERVDAMRRYKG